MHYIKAQITQRPQYFLLLNPGIAYLDKYSIHKARRHYLERIRRKVFAGSIVDSILPPGYACASS